MPSRPLHILLLCHFEATTASTIVEHIQAFPRFSRHRYYVLSNLGGLPAWLDLSRFDGVIVHYSLIASYENYLSSDARRRIRDFDGFKAVFVQDDYRWINHTVTALASMRINALFPLAGPDIIDQVYSPALLPGVHRETVLTGYVPEELNTRPVKPLAERPIDVGYRARKVPMWIGSHTLQKWQIADKFLADAPRFGLKVDISYREEDRIYGDAWIDFVSNCKAVLGTESGASVCDFTGEIQRNVEAHLERQPTATFEELRNLYFKDEDGRIMMNVISPRVFEAACLRTLMIMYEGYYSGIAVPWRHYVPLKRDHSNMAEVVAVLRDHARAQQIVDTAYAEIALNPAYTFRAMVHRVDEVIAMTYQPAGNRLGYSDAEFAWRTGSTLHDLTSYVSASSTLQFERGRALARVTISDADRPSAISAPNQPPPHSIELQISHAMEVAALHVVWDATEAAATSGRVATFRQARRLAESTFTQEEGSLYTRIALPPPLETADRVVVTFDGYVRGEQLRLHDLRLECGRLPVVERVRLFRRRAGVLVLHHASRLWMKLPLPMRMALRRSVRATHDAIFGRTT
jgi:hypothetical protein